MNRSDAERDRGRGGEGTRRQRREAYFLRPGRRVFPAPCPPPPPPPPPPLLPLLSPLFFSSCPLPSFPPPLSLRSSCRSGSRFFSPAAGCSLQRRRPRLLRLSFRPLRHSPRMRTRA